MRNYHEGGKINFKALWRTCYLGGVPGRKGSKRSLVVAFMIMLEPGAFTAQGAMDLEALSPSLIWLRSTGCALSKVPQCFI